MMICGCFIVKQKRKSFSEDNVKTQSQRHSDSLLNSGIDTLIYYFNGSSTGHSNKPDVSYIYYVKNGEYKFIEFYNSNMYAKKNESNRQILKIFHTDFSKAESIYFYEKFQDKMKSEQLVNDTNYFKNNLNFEYMFEIVKIKIGGDSLTYNIKDYNKYLNIDKFKSIFIDKFLLDISNDTYLDKRIRMMDKKLR